jgi:hypothetical protein
VDFDQEPVVEITRIDEMIPVDVGGAAAGRGGCPRLRESDRHTHQGGSTDEQPVRVEPDSFGETFVILMGKSGDPG